MPRSDPPFNRLFNLVRGWPALAEKTVAGVHLVQEDSPDEIGKAIADWMGTLGGRGSAGVTVFAGTRCVQPTKPLPAYEAPPHLCLESDLELNQSVHRDRIVRDSQYRQSEAVIFLSAARYLGGSRCWPADDCPRPCAMT